MSRNTPQHLATRRDEARRLLQSLRSGDSRAAHRFRRLRSFAHLTTDQLLREPERVRLKHALAVLATENGHDSWLAFKRALEAAPTRAGATPAGTADTASALDTASRTPRDGEEWYARGMDVFLNRWFARYDQARAALVADGGYLLPFRHHFFLCTAEAIRTLGLDPDDPDWLRIRFDGARPADSDAWQRLRNQRLTAIRRSAPPRPDPLRLPYQYDIVKIPLKPGDEP